MEASVTQPVSVCQQTGPVSSLSVSVTPSPRPTPPPRRSSCRDIRETLRPGSGVRRTGSLQVASGHQRPCVRRLQHQESGRHSEPRLNILGSDLSGDYSSSEVVSGSRPPLPRHDLVRHGSDRDRVRARRLMQGQDQGQERSGDLQPRRTKERTERTPIKDEFTEFSQYGSRFMLNTVPASEQSEKGKKEDRRNFVEQIQDNKIFKKVASTCQKHYRKTSVTTPTGDLSLLQPPDGARTPTSPTSAEASPWTSAQPPPGLGEERESAPALPVLPTAAPPRHKKLSLALPLGKQQTGEPEKLDHLQLERKTASLFKKAEQAEPSHSVSMNTDPRACWGSRAGSDISKTSSSTRGFIKLRGFSVKSDSDSGIDGDSLVGEIRIKQVDIHADYDLVQLIGEGWYSRVYLAEHRTTRDEVVLKAINSNLVTADEFCREYQSSIGLWPHKNILRVYDAVFQCDGYFMFAMEYAPLGDLTSNITELGLGEIHTKRVCCQVGSALQWIHSKNLCHLDVKLDNILVFKSDFTLVKLCDFGGVRVQGDIVIKKNELLPYCPAELVAKHANEYYQVDRVQDVFQFGIVVFFCLLGVLPWQKADRTDPNFQEFCAWREKRSSKVPKNFKPLTNRAQKMFRKLLDPEPSKRLELGETLRFMEDKWLRKGAAKTEPGKDGQSQLTLGSFQTTVDRSSKNNRIMKWIKQGAERTLMTVATEDEVEEEVAGVMNNAGDSLAEDLEDLDMDRISPE